MTDIIIRNATVLDGTGTPGVVADVAIEAGRIAEVSETGISGTICKQQPRFGVRCRTINRRLRIRVRPVGSRKRRQVQLRCRISRDDGDTWTEPARKSTPTACTSRPG